MEKYEVAYRHRAALPILAGAQLFLNAMCKAQGQQATIASSTACQ